MEHLFTTYVRTKLTYRNRLKDLKNYDTVKVYMYELKKLKVDGPLLYRLRADNEIWYDTKGNFKTVEDGPIDSALLDLTRKRLKVRAPLNSLHRWMRNQLMNVELKIPRADMPVYFKSFLDNRNTQLDAFFTVDGFSGRIHSPIVNLKGELRHGIRFYNEAVVSLDVKQMQPTVLAKVLLQHVGQNSFSKSIFGGEDVYVLLQRKGKLKSRVAAKKCLFQLIFGKPMDGIGKMFEGNTSWVDWINAYKSKEEPRNPHKEDKHTNLAWLLQHSEVEIMGRIWELLKQAGIPFLTIHDDILCLRRHKDQVYNMMERELKRHFLNFSITVDHTI